MTTQMLSYDVGLWQPWDVYFTGLTLGNGQVLFAEYVRIGSSVRGHLKVEFGSTSTMGSGLTFSLPVPAEGWAEDPIGSCVMFDASPATDILGIVRVQTGGLAGHVVPEQASGTYITGNVEVAATVPFTWAATDTFWLSFNYEAA